MKQVYPTTIQSGMSQTGSCLLMLHEPEGGRQIPIVIGRSEAQSILLALHPEESGRIRRPTTHQLMVEMMNTYGLTVSKVVIEKVVEGVFYATLHVSDGFNEHRIDSRTTDAVTLEVVCDPDRTEEVRKNFMEITAGTAVFSEEHTELVKVPV